MTPKNNNDAEDETALSRWTPNPNGLSDLLAAVSEISHPLGTTPSESSISLHFHTFLVGFNTLESGTTFMGKCA